MTGATETSPPHGNEAVIAKQPKPRAKIPSWAMMLILAGIAAGGVLVAPEEMLGIVELAMIGCVVAVWWLLDQGNVSALSNWKSRVSDGVAIVIATWPLTLIFVNQPIMHIPLQYRPIVGVIWLSLVFAIIAWVKVRNNVMRRRGVGGVVGAGLPGRRQKIFYQLGMWGLRLYALGIVGLIVYINLSGGYVRASSWALGAVTIYAAIWAFMVKRARRSISAKPPGENSGRKRVMLLLIFLVSANGLYWAAAHFVSKYIYHELRMRVSFGACKACGMG